MFRIRPKYVSKGLTATELEPWTLKGRRPDSQNCPLTSPNTCTHAGGGGLSLLLAVKMRDGWQYNFVGRMNAGFNLRH